MEVVRCDNCKKDIPYLDQRFIVRVRQGEYATIAGAPDHDFCSVKCVSEFYTRALEGTAYSGVPRPRPWPR